MPIKGNLLHLSFYVRGRRKNCPVSQALAKYWDFEHSIFKHLFSHEAPHGESFSDPGSKGTTSLQLSSVHAYRRQELRYWFGLVGSEKNFDYPHIQLTHYKTCTQESRQLFFSATGRGGSSKRTCYIHKVWHQRQVPQFSLFLYQVINTSFLNW